MSDVQTSSRPPQPKRKPHIGDWYRVEPEVSLYFMHEESVSSVNFDKEGSVSTEPQPPCYPPYVDFWKMMTAIDRLVVADRHMPLVARRVTLKLPGPGEQGALPVQTLVGQPRPSCTMVLRAAYGSLASKYDDMAPRGPELLREAKLAYLKAAAEVPRRERPKRVKPPRELSRDEYESHIEAIRRLLGRAG